ncbi:MAG TPA: hypothetical protein PKY81_10810 [bacterium]|nr:hypothetical protein [bacterium]
MTNKKKWNTDEKNALVSATIGGMLLGGSLGSTPGAIVGGLFGIIAAIIKKENDSKNLKIE